MTTLVKSLSIYMEDYGPDKGKLKGSVEFVGVHGEIKVRLNNDTAGRMLAVVADNLVSAARETAAMMTAQVIAQAEGATLIEG